MRIFYENKKIYLSLVDDEFDRLEKHKPLELDIGWLKVIQKDISDCISEYWSEKEKEK